MPTAYLIRPGKIPGLSLLAVLAWAGAANAQQTITKTNITSITTLVSYFAEADANPSNTYNLYLGWVKDGNGNTVPFKPSSPITLAKGTVNLFGSNTHLYADRYVFDGQKQRRVFMVVGAAGYRPNLHLTGITVRNGYGSGEFGGGLYASNAGYVLLEYCQFLRNRTDRPGSAIFAQATTSLYVFKSLIKDNANWWYGGCGGGEMGNGGGIAVWQGGAADVYFSIHNSTISNDTACRGGGILTKDNVTVNMHNNTFSGNVAQQAGGAAAFENSNKPSYFYHNTIYNNSAGTPIQPSDGYSYGGGVYFNNFNGAGYWSGNVIAKNLVGPQAIGTYPEDCHVKAGSPAFQRNINVVGRIGNCTQLGTPGTWGIGQNPPGSKFDPLLGGLAVGTSNDGFALPVHLPASNSPLRGNYFNAASGYNCPSVDERGWPRKSNGCDIGAAERGADGIP
jgi:hypothetical protein